jgi:hypothetical protein
MKVAKLMMGVLLSSALLTPTSYVRAEETTGEKAADVGRDTKKTAKKWGRHAKKSVRDSTGHHDGLEDTKDKAKNVGDEAKDKVQDTKDKVD